MKNFLNSAWSKTKTVGSKTWSFAKKHKIVTGIIVLILIFGGYSAYAAITNGKAATTDTIAAVSQGPLTVTVSDSGEVSAEHQLNLSPQASGQVTSVDVVAGQQVKAGQTVATLDMTTAEQSVESARENLESAQISYQQTLTSSQNGTTNDQTSLTSSQQSGNNTITSVYSDLPTVVNGLKSVLYSNSTISNYTAQQNIDAYATIISNSTTQQYRQQVSTDYQSSFSSSQAAQSEYNSYDPSSATEAREVQMLSDTLTTLQTLDQTVRDTLNYYNYINNQMLTGGETVPSSLTSQISSLNSYSSTLNTDISNVQSARTSLQNAEQTLEADTQTLNGASGPSLTLQSAQLNVQKAQESLDQAIQNESNYVVTAPFDGTIASVGVKQYDQASSGTAVAVLVTNENYVDISMNEADVAKVSLGNPASITFDAISGLTIQGTVAEIDDVGTVSQGVATYDVKIGFDTQDSRVKPGMTAEATITTNSVANAIQVPSSAVHTVGNNSYVEVATLTGSSTPTGAGGFGSSTSRAGFAGRTGSSTARFRTGSSTGSFGSTTGAFNTSSTTPLTSITARTFSVPVSDVKTQQVQVLTGISNDTQTQITSGLKPGQFVVTATNSASKTSTTGGSIFSLFGGGNRTTTGTTGTGAAGAGGATLRVSGGGGFGGGGGGGFRAGGGGFGG